MISVITEMVELKSTITLFVFSSFHLFFVHFPLVSYLFALNIFNNFILFVGLLSIILCYGYFRALIIHFYYTF